MHLSTYTGGDREKAEREAKLLNGTPSAEPTQPKPTANRKRRKRSSSLPPTLPDPTPSLDPECPDESIAVRIRNIRLRYLNWTYNWGPANLWEREFNKLMEEARKISQVEVDEFFEELDEHTRKGRDILKELRYTGAGTCVGEYGVFIDLFVQGFDMAVDIASEVKFFEVKLDEFAPVVPTVVQSEIRYISD
jgi:hypothetical protein